MKLGDIRSDHYYAEGGMVPLIEYQPPDEDRKAQHGTTITLSDLTLSKTIKTASSSLVLGWVPIMDG